MPLTETVWPLFVWERWGAYKEYELVPQGTSGRDVLLADFSDNFSLRRTCMLGTLWA